jgi:translocation and assembly module TamB
MPVDDRDERAKAADSSPKENKEQVAKALQSETDAPLPPAAERIAERDANQPEPKTPQGQRRRYLTRRNAFIATIAIAALIVGLILFGVITYRLGYLDRYVVNQIKTTFAEYGIRTEIKDFHAGLGSRTVEMTGLELYDQKTGAPLGKIGRLLATVRIEDLYALNLHRNVNLESLEVDNLEAWVTFDKDGRSNFSNIKLPEPAPNQRILFSYSTAKVTLNNALLHYGDEQHNLSGEARGVRATVQPDDPNAPAASWMNTVTFATTGSTFVYDGRTINDIGIEAQGRVNQTRAEIQNITLRSPVAEAHLQGVMDDWRNLHYTMQVTSSVDLTQISDVLQNGVAMRGAGNFVGTVTGEGSRYKVQGEIKSDALAADNIRLQALNVNATASGDGSAYDINGKAVAQLFTMGDFQLSALQLAGHVMGTGTNFRWLGDLRAASARYGGEASITNLILNDVSAELRDKELTASAGGVNVGGAKTSGATIAGAHLSDLHLRRSEDGVTTATVSGAQVGTINASGARINGVSASGINAVDKNGTTNVIIAGVRVGGLNASGAQVGSINIAGVRLAIHDGRIEGSSGDINAGTINIAATKDMAAGRIESVRIVRPVFTVEPSGRYRASADLSLGGGVLGQVNLGAARASVVASNNQIQLNNLAADILQGHVAGNATISTARGGSSRVNADFNDLDVGRLLSISSGRVLPVAGSASGNVDLAFAGTDIARSATGTLRADFKGETGNEDSGRTPLTGTVAVRADRGLFNIEQANLRTAASELNATGQFSVAESRSNLNINLASSDASELQNIVLTSGLVPETYSDSLKDIKLGGQLAFNATVSGALNNPNIDGRASVASLNLKGRDLGSLSAALNVSPTDINITDGKLTQRGGGGATFSVNAPRVGDNNIAVEATLDRVNAGNLLAALASNTANNGQPASAPDIQADLSGNIKVTGLPNAMNGSANLSAGAGNFGPQTFENFTARATFNGSNVNLERVEANLDGGQVTANGSYNMDSKAFDLNANASGVQLGALAALAGNSSAVPRLTGTADLTAHVNGVADIARFKIGDVTINGAGQNVTINGRDAGTLLVEGRTVNQQLSLNLTTGILGQPQVIAATVDLGNEKFTTTVKTSFNNADLSPLFAALMPDSSVKVMGHATGTVDIKGDLIDEDGYPSATGLRGSAEFTDLTFQVQDVQLSATSPLRVQFAANEIIFEKTQFTGPGTNVTFGGTAALAAGGRQNLSVDGRLNLSVLNSLSPDIFLSGGADAAVRVTGTFEQPKISGTASLAGASVSAIVMDERLTATNIKGSVIFNANQARIQSLTANLGGGTVTASGGAVLDGFALAREGFRIAVHADDVTIPLPEDIRATADADVEIGGTTRQQFVTGVVNLRRAEYTKDIELADIVNRRREGSLSESGGGGGDDSSFATTTQLDLRVEGRDALIVRNNLADMVGSASLRITGSADDPIISGRITATRGTLSFRNNRFELTRAFIDLPAQRDADPILNIQAEAEIRGYNTIVSLTGPLSSPNAVVRSDPSLPQADVVSLILTGELAGDDPATSSLSQTGLGTAASLLTNSLINAPAQRATDKLFGLNRFAIDPLVSGRGGASPTARLTVGRQINKDLSIIYSTNVTGDQNQVLALEYRVSNRLSFVAQYEQGATSGFTTRGNNFSFEIRFRKRF